MNPVVRRDPGDRWRLFAVAACGGAVKSQHEGALYVERLRARRAPSCTAVRSITRGNVMRRSALLQSQLARRCFLAGVSG